MRIVLTVIISLSIILSIAGCATIMKGSSQNLNISSAPSGADIKINGIPIGTSPMIVKLSTKNEYSVVLELDGYLPYTVMIKKSVSGWAWGNIFLGGIIGLIVDISTGSIYQLSKEQINVQLKENGVGNIESEEGKAYVFFTMKPDSSLNKIGQLTGSKK